MLQNYLKLILNIPLTRRPIREKFDFLLICHDDDRRVLKNNLYYSPILDGIKEELVSSGYRCITFAKLGSKIYKKAYGDVYPLLTWTDLFNFKQIKYLLKNPKSYTRLPLKIREIIKKSKIKAIAGIELDCHLAKFGRENNIPVIEIFHGYGLSTNHHEYGKQVFELTPVEKLFSDYIVLDNYSKKILYKNSITKKDHIRIWSMLSPVLKNLNPKKKILNKFSNYEKIFLVSLQYGSSPGCIIEDGDINEKIKETIQGLKNENYLFLIKPHPISIKQKTLMNNLSAYCKKNPNCLLIKDYGISDLTNLIDLHLTSSSGVTRECALNGIKSLLYSNDDYLFSGKDYHLKFEIENNLALRVNKKTSAEIIQLLLKIQKNKDPEDSEHFKKIKPDFNNTVTLFNRILKNNLSNHKERSME